MSGVTDWVLVPREFGIPADAWESAQFAFGGPGTGGEGEAFIDCTAWIGEIERDDGSKTHGLHLSCDECPEEGSITLAEFAAAPSPPAEAQVVGGGEEWHVKNLALLRAGYQVDLPERNEAYDAAIAALSAQPRLEAWKSPFGSCVCEGANECPGCNPNVAIELARTLSKDEERRKHPPCWECGATSAKDAETMCHCSGDKDDCHGCALWPHGDTAPRQDEVARDAWKTVDAAPIGVPVLLAIQYANGNQRVIRAIRAGERTVPLGEESEPWDGCFYDEEEDVYYCAPGWYEKNGYEETNWAVDHTPIAWQPLPAPPAIEATGGGS